MFRVAIVGRPNVGNRTLLNRRVGRRRALVDDRPGVTRDRREAEAQLGDLVFTVIDTAGLEEAPTRSLGARMRDQTGQALRAVDVVLFVIDARAGVTPTDRHFANWLRKAGRPILLVANKTEPGANLPGVDQASRLRFCQAIPVSAEHGEGLADLHAALRPHAPDDAVLAHRNTRDEDDAAPEATDKEEERPIRVAIIGRPNVGESTLVNRLLGEERLLTGPEPGITRDAIEIPWNSGKHRFVLIDTAGLRKKARIDDPVEKLSTSDAIQSLREAQVVILAIDATMLPENSHPTIPPPPFTASPPLF